ncbi:hypothetical protein SHIRM173S_09074 [Streptomyces hirsutus]
MPVSPILGHRPSRSTEQRRSQGHHHRTQPRSAPSSSGAAGRPGLCGRTACCEPRVRCADSWLPAARARDVVAGDRGVGGAAEAGHGPQDGVGERFSGTGRVLPCKRLWRCRNLSALPGRTAGDAGHLGRGGGFPVPAPARGARRLPAWKASAAACCSSVGFSTAWLGEWVRVRPRAARRGEGVVSESRCRTARSRRSASSTAHRAGARPVNRPLYEQRQRPSRALGSGRQSGVRGGLEGTIEQDLTSSGDRAGHRIHERPASRPAGARGRRRRCYRRRWRGVPAE